MPLLEWILILVFVLLLVQLFTNAVVLPRNVVIAVIVLVLILFLVRRGGLF